MSKEKKCECRCGCDSFNIKMDESLPIKDRMLLVVCVDCDRIIKGGHEIPATDFYYIINHREAG